MIQAKKKSGGAGMEILKEVIKVTPALIGVGVHMAALSGGCVIT